MATRAIRCIKTDSRCANGGRAGEERLLRTDGKQGVRHSIRILIFCGYTKNFLAVGRDGQVVRIFRRIL